MRRRRLVRRVTFAAALALTVALADLGIIFYRVYSAPPPPPFPGPAYLEAEYKTLSERLTDGGYWITNEHHGTYYNFNADGERRVVGQPSRYRHTIWLFGNSGTQDPYTTDAQSIASRLQTLLPTYRIVNRSAGGQRIIGEFAWLRDTPVRAGDMVVFVDGGMDHDTPAAFWSTSDQVQRYVVGKGALWLHLVQPSSFSLAPLAPFVDVPDSDFVNDVHLNADGDRLVARALYGVITLL